MSERLAHALCLRTIQRIVDLSGVKEVSGEDGGPFAVLTSKLGPEPTPTGEVRIWLGDGPVEKVVYAGIWNEVIGLDSHMVYAFTAADSAVPHFTLDSVYGHGYYAFHLDLTPRVDLGANLAYIDEVFMPLQEMYDETRALEGLTEPAIGPRQRAMMSPWMLVSRSEEATYRKLDAPVNTYLDHWFSLAQRGVSQTTLDSLKGAGLAERDVLNRGNIFSREVDAVWDQITPLIGRDDGELIRLNLLANELVQKES